MVHKNCFIAGCLSKSDQEKGPVSLFKAPKTFFKEWEEKIPKKGFTAISRICSRHFDDDDIIKGKMIGGVFYAHKVWRLKCGALPKHFLDTPSIKDNKRIPLQSLTTNQVASVKKKSLKRRCKTIQSILGKAGQPSASDSNSSSLTSHQSLLNDNEMVNITEELGFDSFQSHVTGIDESMLIPTEMDHSQNHINMADC